MVTCNGCGSPIGNESICKECGLPVASTTNESLELYNKLTCGYCGCAIGDFSLCRECGASQLIERPTFRKRSFSSPISTTISSDMYTDNQVKFENVFENIKVCHISVFKTKDGKTLCSVCEGTIGSSIAKKPILEELKFLSSNVENDFDRLVDEINQSKGNLLDKILSFSNSLTSSIFPTSILDTLRKM
ncbi:MAG: hypothetical protein OEY49_14080, partial [Candidatus Heimdallarchaeota archaeon]|nr:hypothetical protein [Candidatus Heimdallarchaeota archaeon]